MEYKWLTLGAECLLKKTTVSPGSSSNRHFTIVYLYYTCIVQLVTMNKVEENVLISKEEYETLLEKVNAANDKDIVANTSMNSEGSNSNAKENVDEGNASTPPPASDKAQESEDILEKTKPSNTSSPTKSEGGGGKDDVENLEDENVDTSMVDILLEKVPSNLKESVRFLANYIVENGQGIIEWDKELRFIHVKETIPKTNFAKLIIYALEKNDGKPPKGMTVFKRTLKAIGISNVKSWVFSQTGGGMMSPYGGDQESKGKRSFDVMDGAFDNKAKKIKKGSGKSDKLNKLSKKWLTW